MIVLVLLVQEFGRWFFGERAGFYAGLVMGTSAGAFLFTRIMIPEALYALEFTAAFYLLLRAWTGTLPPRVGWWGYAALVGLATLTRAGIGTLFPVGIAVIFLLSVGAWRRGSDARRRLAAAPIWTSAAVALIVALPWHLVAGLRAPGFWWFYFVNEQVLRALGKRYPADYTAVPLWLWWTAHLVWFFPWSLYLPYVWREIPPVRVWSLVTDAALQARVFVLVWAAVIFLFFSIVGGSRMEYYGFGAWPAVAILVGSGLARAEEQRDRWLTGLQGALAVVCAAVAIVLIVMLWESRAVTNASDISSLLGRHDTSFYRVSMATLLDLTPQAFAALRTPAFLAAIAFIVGPIVAWLLRRRGRSTASTVTVAVTMTMFCYAANLAFEAFEPRLSSRPLAAELKGVLAPGDRLVVYGEFEQACSFSFYSGRSAWIYRGRYNGLEFGSYFPDAPRIFLDDGEFDSLWRGPSRIFLFVPPEQRESALANLPPNMLHLVAAVGGKAVYANQQVGAIDGHERSFSTVGS